MTTVLTQLRAGDELGSYPGHEVPRERNLSQLYNLSPKAIAALNGVRETLPVHEWTQAIEGRGGMLERAGSKTWTGVRYLIDASTRITLPIGGPRAPVPGSGDLPVAAVAGGGLLGLALLGGAAYFLLGD